MPDLERGKSTTLEDFSDRHTLDTVGLGLELREHNTHDGKSSGLFSKQECGGLRMGGLQMFEMMQRITALRIYGIRTEQCQTLYSRGTWW